MTKMMFSRQKSAIVTRKYSCGGIERQNTMNVYVRQWYLKFFLKITKLAKSFINFGLFKQTTEMKKKMIN